MTTLPSRITAFRDGRQCSTRSSLNFEICGAVARCRFEIFLVSANIPADWVVLGYSWAAIGTPWSADGSEWRPPPLSQRHSASTRSIHLEPQPMLDCFKEPLAQDRCAGGGAEATHCTRPSQGASAHFHLILPKSLKSIRRKRSVSRC